MVRSEQALWYFAFVGFWLDKCKIRFSLVTVLGSLLNVMIQFQVLWLFLVFGFLPTTMANSSLGERPFPELPFNTSSYHLHHVITVATVSNLHQLPWMNWNEFSFILGTYFIFRFIHSFIHGLYFIVGSIYSFIEGS